MTEQEALRKFEECTKRKDLDGACAALESITTETLTHQDAGGRDMLIRAVAGGDPCASEALLRCGRCDLNHREKLSGRRAAEFAMEQPEDSRIRRLFLRFHLTTKYSTTGLFNFLTACQKNDAEVVKAHLEAGLPFSLNRNEIYSLPPGFLQPLPLAAAVKANAAECVELLTAYGADPDAFCRKNGKTPRELAADKAGILAIFNRGGRRYE